MSGMENKTCRDCRKALAVGRRGSCKCWILSNVNRGWKCIVHPVCAACGQFSDNGKNTTDGRPSKTKKTKETK